MRRHAPTCNCRHCERDGSGDFAVRAFAEGEREALDRLSKPVASVLPSLVLPSLVEKKMPRRKAA
jgi:hypothetical protein